MRLPSDGGGGALVHETAALTPRPLPRSTTQSAARICPSSCSTTTTVLPRSRIPSASPAAAGCRAGAGPRRARPGRRGCPACGRRSGPPAGCGGPRPPESVVVGRSRLRYRPPPAPGSAARSRICWRRRSATGRSRSGTPAPRRRPGPRHRQPHVVGQRRPPTRTARLSWRRRAPRHSAQPLGQVGPQVLEGLPPSASAPLAPAAPRRRPPAGAAGRAARPRTRCRRLRAAPGAPSATGRAPASRARTRGGGPRPPAPPARGAARGAARVDGALEQRAPSSGTTLAGSTSQLRPSPSHPGQAP